MNENIQELYRKVLHESAERWNHPDAEKFAKLIINECIGTVQKRYMGDHNREDAEVLRCVADLKQHVGIIE
jgi:hypothetical protein